MYVSGLHHANLKPDFQAFTVKPCQSQWVYVDSRILGPTCENPEQRTLCECCWLMSWTLEVVSQAPAVVIDCRQGCTHTGRLVLHSTDLLRSGEWLPSGGKSHSNWQGRATLLIREQQFSVRQLEESKDGRPAFIACYFLALIRTSSAPLTVPAEWS